MGDPNDMNGSGLGFTDREVRRGLWASIAATSLGAMHYRLLWPTGLLAVGLMLSLGVSKYQVAVLTATMPLSRFAEIISSYATQRTGRRRELFTWAHILSRLLWVPLALTYFISGEYLPWRVPALFVILLASSLLAWTAANAWLSWMGDLLPSGIRGRYFGVRQVCEKTFEIVGGLCVGWYLSMGETTTHTQYVIVVCVLVTFGILDILVFRFWVPHPVLEPTRKRGQLRQLIAVPLRDRRYKRLVLFLAGWTFASGLLQPYIWVFIKGEEYLGLSYMMGYVILAVSGVCLGGTSYFWGHFGDRWNPRKALALCVAIGFTPPFYYLFATPQNTLPIYLAWAVGSIAWSGILVYTFQYGISMAPARERSMYLAFQSAVLGLVQGAAFLSAGGILKLMAWTDLRLGGYSDLQILFCLAGLGRLLSFIPLIRMEGSHRS